MDASLLAGVVLLVVAVLGLAGVIGAVANFAWILLLIALIIIGWRIVTGRRPV